MVVVEGVSVGVVDDVGAMVVVEGVSVAVVDDVGATVVVDGIEIAVVNEVDMVNPTKSISYYKNIKFLS